MGDAIVYLASSFLGGYVITRIILLVSLLFLVGAITRPYLSTVDDDGEHGHGEYFETEVDAKDINLNTNVGQNSLIGETIQETLNREYWPTLSEKVTYSGYQIISVQFFKTSSQLISGRLAKIDLTYNGLGQVTQELRRYYDSNGTTVLKTVTITIVWNGWKITKVNRVTS